MLPTHCGYPADMFSTTRDVSALCVGTPLDGTCVQAFVRAVATCFRPAGCCIAAGNTRPHDTWASGAFLLIDGTFGDWVEVQDGVVCGRTDFSGHTAQTWTAWDGTTLTMHTDTNIATCSDGTSVALGGPHFDACPDIIGVLFPTPNPSCSRAQYPGDAGPACCTPYPIDWNPPL